MIKTTLVLYQLMVPVIYNDEKATEEEVTAAVLERITEAVRISLESVAYKEPRPKAEA
jgi:hypothetical protein